MNGNREYKYVLIIGVIADCGIYGTVGAWSSYQVYENLCLSSTVLFFSCWHRERFDFLNIENVA
jgi:hypothetical protein